MCTSLYGKFLILSIWCIKKISHGNNSFAIFLSKGSDKMKVGVDLGGSHIAIGVVDDEGNMLEKNEKRLICVEK